MSPAADLPALEFALSTNNDIAAPTGVLVVLYHDADALSKDFSNPLLRCSDWRIAAGKHKGTTPLVIHLDDLAIVLVPLGGLTREYDDVRRYAQAASRAIKTCIEQDLGANSNVTMLVQCPPENPLCDFSEFHHVTALSALAEVHILPEVMEAATCSKKPASSAKAFVDAASKIKGFRILLSSLYNGPLMDQFNKPVNALGARDFAESVMTMQAIELGRRLARDVGGSDPERMAALKAASLIESFFQNNFPDTVRVRVERNVDAIAKEYPLMAAVARCSLAVDRHRPAVVHLDYISPDQSQVAEELYMVGKGITYDTGGADLKVGGHMVGMSRDKGGAAALAGFMATCAALKPNHVNVHISLAFVRNSIGPDSYVSDEIIKSRAGVRVRVGNTDAEGRMVMADLLCEMSERMSASTNATHSSLFSCATLTGHVIRCYGAYAAALENGAARMARIGQRIQQAGESIGDCFELSRLRREDYDFVAPCSVREDVVQANSLPSTMTNRGHQYPAAFLQIAAGLLNSSLPYTHLDIAGVAEELPGPLGRLTGAPIPALTRALLRRC